MVAMDKRIKADKETVDLVKEYIATLLKEQGIRYTQASAIKIALRKVLLK